MTVGWIAERLAMGTRSYLNHLLYRRRKLGGNQYQELTHLPIPRTDPFVLTPLSNRSWTTRFVESRGSEDKAISPKAPECGAVGSEIHHPASHSHRIHPSPQAGIFIAAKRRIIVVEHTGRTRPPPNPRGPCRPGPLIRRSARFPEDPASRTDGSVSQRDAGYFKH